MPCFIVLDFFGFYSFLFVLPARISFLLVTRALKLCNNPWRFYFWQFCFCHCLRLIFALRKFFIFKLFLFTPGFFPWLAILFLAPKIVVARARISLFPAEVSLCFWRLWCCTLSAPLTIFFKWLINYCHASPMLAEFFLSLHEPD